MADWVTITKETDAVTQRLAVAGGTLYRVLTVGQGPNKHLPPNVALTFVPDGYVVGESAGFDNFDERPPQEHHS